MKTIHRFGIGIIGSLLLLIPLQIQGQEKTRPELAASAIPPLLQISSKAIIREERIQWEIQSVNQAEMEYYCAYTLLEEVPALQRLDVLYNAFSKIDQLEAYLYDAQGSLIRKIKEKDFEDRAVVDGFSIARDDRYLSSTVQYRQYPYTVVWRYRKSYKGIMGTYSGWTQPAGGVAVESASLSVKMPDPITLNHQVVNFPEKRAPEYTLSPDGWHRWEIGQLLPVIGEVLAPAFHEITPAIRLAPSRFRVEGYEGSMESWQTFGAFLYQLNSGRTPLSEATRERVAQIKANAPDRQSTIRQLYRFLQQNHRYVSIQLGIGGWKAFDTEIVENKKYGDCKALSWYMQDLLQEADIPSFPAITQLSEDPLRINDSLPFLGVYNHAILYLPDEDMWLECTSTEHPVGYPGKQNFDKHALLITPEGGKLHPTPTHSKNIHFREGYHTIELSADGHAEIQSRELRSGQFQEWQRVYLGKQYSHTQLEERFTRRHALSPFELNTLDLRLDSLQPRCVVNYQLTRPNFAAASGTRLFFSINNLYPFENPLPKDDHRIHPVVQTENWEMRDTIDYQLPVGYRVEALPFEQETLDTPYGILELTLQEKPGRLRFTRTLWLKPFTEKADAYESVFQFFQAVNKYDLAKVVLVNQS